MNDTKEKLPDEYGVQTQRTVESWDMSKDGKNQLRTTKLVSGMIGPFRNRDHAEDVASALACTPGLVNARVITIVDGPEPERQVPASEDILAQMVKDGKVPGVPADATVRQESPAADNTIQFPSPATPAE